MRLFLSSFKDPYGQPADESNLNEFRIIAMECLALSLPKASNCHALANFLREHAFQARSTERLTNQFSEIAIPCLKYVTVWSITAKFEPP